MRVSVSGEQDECEGGGRGVVTRELKPVRYSGMFYGYFNEIFTK